MTKTKQTSSIELIKSFTKNAYNHLNTEDRSFCDQLVLKGLNWPSMEETITDYLSVTGHERDLDLQSAGQISNYMTNYTASRSGLLLSYSPSNDAVNDIHKKYYKPAPINMELTFVVIPLYKLLIKTAIAPGEAWYGARRDKAGSLLDIKVFRLDNEWQLLYDGSFINTQYPRYSKSCQAGMTCTAYIASNLLFDAGDGISYIYRHECRMGPNRSQICLYEQEYTKKYGVGLPGFLALVLMCYDKWQKRPMKQYLNRNKFYPGDDVSLIITDTPQWEHISKGYREVRLNNYLEIAEHIKISRRPVENRVSPCEHARRGHMRKLKDGRVISVRPSIVNKGGEKIIYKIDRQK